MSYLPIFFSVADKPCLVVGGGEVAARKVRQLLNVQAKVLVVAPQLCDELEQMRVQREIRHEQRAFAAGDLAECVLAIAATDDAAVNEQVSKLAQKARIPVNVVDAPALCSFIVPALVERGPLKIAISTGGASPVLARLLRARLETILPSSYGRLAGLMQAFRARAKEKFPDIRQRRRFWEQVLSGPIAEMFLAGQDRPALAALTQQLDNSDNPLTMRGEVYLVGGGPGDPDLLTFRALRLMQQADAVLYDRLVSPLIVELTRKDAERIYVGKKRNQHALPQDEINRLLVKLARQGKRVLRLKGGDPFIFGRGGEEIEELAAEGIHFQIVPGVTAAAGCASYAGIPLTHRDHAQSCLFVTGHLKDGSLDLNWDALIQPGQTLAIYMGMKGIDILSSELIRHGMSAEMPAAIIQQGTRPKQRVFISDLARLADVVEKNAIKPPAMTIIGKVVTLHKKLAWYEP